MTTKPELLFGAAQKWAAGITLHTPSLLLVRYPVSPLNSLLGNARQMELVYQTSRSFTLAVSNALITSRENAVAYIEKTRTTLKPYLGERWSTAWAQAGFPKGTLKVPASNTLAVVQIVRTLQGYLLANPAQQNTLNGATAAAAGTLVTALDAGLAALSNAKSQQNTKRLSREVSQKDLSAYLRDSRKEVGSAMQPNDPRWRDFIEKEPGVLQAPEAVSAIVAEPGLPGHIRLSFLPALRAAAYGVYVSTDGGATYAHFTTIHDTVADLVFTPGATLKIRVKASNAAGQSAPSPVAEVTVPVAVAA
jgi:hypothetical protein